MGEQWLLYTASQLPFENDVNGTKGTQFIIISWTICLTAATVQ